MVYGIMCCMLKSRRCASSIKATSKSASRLSRRSCLVIFVILSMICFLCKKCEKWWRGDWNGLIEEI